MKLLAADLDAHQPLILEDDFDAPSREDEQTVAFLLSLRGKGIRDKELLRAFETVPRNLFVESRYGDLARSNIALPIPCGQTTLAPTVVARLISALNVKRHHIVLEIGTGSGYVTALLARLSQMVISFERFHTLALGAAQRLPQLGISNVELYHADGLEAGHDIEAVDRIILMGSVDDLPENLLLALKPEGRLVAVVEQEGERRLSIVTRHESGEFSLQQDETINLSRLINGVALAL